MATAVIGKELYKTSLLTSGHELIADEPEEIGGGNLGPGAGEFLLLSLASCIAITLRMYANRKNWPVDEIRVEVISDNMDKTTYFHCHVYLQGTLDDAQRARMLQIANLCPVHKVLTHPIEIKTSLQ
jgi:putative redox protein